MTRAVRVRSLLAAVALGLLVGPSTLSRAAPGEPAADRPAPALAVPSPAHSVSPTEAFGEALVTHARNERRPEREKAEKPKHEKRGDVAVIVDRGHLTFGGRPDSFTDLVGPVAIDFVPVTGGGYRVALADAEADFPGGQPLELMSPSDTQEVPLGFEFPFFGTSYGSVWVNGAGNVTFGAGDTDPFDPNALRDAGRFLRGPPRVAPLYSDLFPQSVLADVRPDHAVITWATGAFSFQLTLSADGAIRFAYPRAFAPDREIGESVVGIAPGNGQGPIRDTNFVAALPATFPAGAIYEEFGAAVSRFDLPAENLVFTPTGDGFAVATEPLTFDPAVGSALPLGDDDTEPVALPFSFPFLGASYNVVHVNSDGNITFGAGDAASTPRDPLRLLRGPPRIAPFLADLNPEGGGSINASVRRTEVVITWTDVPEFGSANRNTFQLTLENTGEIVVAYRSIEAELGVVGVAAGGFAQPAHEIDLTGDLPATLQARAIFEGFGSTFEHFDLFDRSLTFTPSAGGFRVERGRGGFDDSSGFADIVATGCESVGRVCDAPEVRLQFAFPFLGRSHDRLYVNDWGNVTFGAPDPEPLSAGSLVAGPPRLAPLGFNFRTGTLQYGAVRAVSEPERAVVTWDGVLDNSGVELGLNTFQVILHRDGTVRFVHAQAEAIEAIVGLAEGARSLPINEVDLTRDLPATFDAGVIFEEFRFGFPFPEVDLVDLAREFYAVYPDQYDFLVVFTDFPTNLSGPAVALNVLVHNDTSGLGLPLYDGSSLFGSSGELEAFVQMNNVNIYWPDAHRLVDPPVVTEGSFRHRVMGIGDGGPATRTTGLWHDTLNSPMSVLAQEAGHRWLAAARFIHPASGVGEDSLDLLGRALSHWSFLADTTLPSGQFQGEPRASSLEGNVIRDHGGLEFGPGGPPPCRTPGDHAFTTDEAELTDGYSALDQYLMGLRAPSDVPPFFYVDDATGFIVDRTGRLVPVPVSPDQRPRSGFNLCGRRVDLTIEDVIAHPEMGPRVPAVGDEDDDGQGTDVKTMAFILVTQTPDALAHADAVKRVDTFRKTWEKYANGDATGGRGRFDTSLTPRIH